MVSSMVAGITNKTDSIRSSFFALVVNNSLRTSCLLDESKMLLLAGKSLPNFHVRYVL